MKKSILKCILVLTAISLVCAVLLVLGNKFLPPREVEINYGAIVGDSTVTAEDFDVLTLDAEQKTALGALSKSVTEVAQRKSEPAVMVVTIKQTFKYGTLTFMVGVRVGATQSDDRVLGMQLIESKASGTMFTDTLSKDVYNFFLEKDPFSVTGETIRDEVKSGATLTAQAVADCVQNACRVARILVVGGGANE